MLPVGPKLRLPLLLSCMLLVILLQVSDAKRDLKSACSTCRQITDNFNKVTDPLLICYVFLLYCQDASVSGCPECLMMPLYLCCTGDFIFYLFYLSFKGFERTAKQNFGGGNTAWEERKLSKYETR